MNCAKQKARQKTNGGYHDEHFQKCEPASRFAMTAHSNSTTGMTKAHDMPPNVRMSRRPRLRALGKTSGSDGSIRWFAGKRHAANRNKPSNGRSARSTVARRPGRDGRRYIAQLRANKPAAHPHVRRRRLPANELSHAGPRDVNRAAEPEPLPGVGCSDF